MTTYYRANFKTQWYLTVNTDPQGLASISGSGWYDQGTTAYTGTAPSSVNSYTFSTWKVDGGSVSGNPISVKMEDPHTATAIYTIINKPILSVDLINPSNGATVSSSPVTLQARVTSEGSGIQGVTIRYFIDGSQVGSVSSDPSGYASYDYSPSQGTHSWYVTAEKSSDYNSGSSSTWTFIYSTGAQAPSLTLYTPEVNGLSVTINGATDPGSSGASITRIHWNWGDGIEEDHWFPASHNYGQAGTYTITVTSYQSDGLTATKTVTITLDVSVLPDLTIQNLGFDKSEPFTEGDIIFFGATIINQGDAIANHFYLEVRIDGQLLSFGGWSLGAHQFTTWSAYGNSWTATTGTHTVEWIVDTTDEVPESNENNNAMSKTFTVGARDLPPVAFIDSISPNPVCQGQAVTFIGHGSDPDGSVVAYEWRSSIDGLLNGGILAGSIPIVFSTSTVSVGTHIIYFKVQDDDGAWSTEVTAALTVSTIQPSSIMFGPIDVNPGESFATSGNFYFSGCICPSHASMVTITFTKPDGSQEYVTCQSDDNGYFSFVYVFDYEGTWQAQSSWLGDQDHEGATSLELFNVVCMPTSLSMDPIFTKVGDTIKIAAGLHEATGESIPNADIIFSLASHDWQEGMGVMRTIGHASTDASGTATLSYTLPSDVNDVDVVHAGIYKIVAYFGKTEKYAQSEASAELTVMRLRTVMSLNCPSSVWFDANDVRVIATLTDERGNPIIGSQILFEEHASDGRVTIQVSRTTDSSGSVTLIIIANEAGDFTETATFNGSQDMEDSSAERRLTVIDYRLYVFLAAAFITVTIAGIYLFIRRPRLPPPPP